MLQFVSALHETKHVLVVAALVAATTGCKPAQPPPPKEPQWVAAQPTTTPPPTEGQKDPPPAPIDGKALYEAKGCMMCHSLDGSPKVGPSFKGAWGIVVNLTDGSTATYDEAYVKESILDGQRKLRVGFPPSHPAFAGQLTDDEVTALVVFIKAQT